MSNLKTSVISKLPKTCSLTEMFEDVSIYIKLSQIGGKEVAPDYLLGPSIFVDCIKFCNFPAPLLSLHSIFQFCKKKNQHG